MSTAKRAVDEGLVQPHTPRCKKVKKEAAPNSLDTIQGEIKSECKEMVSILSELVGIEDYPWYEEGMEEEEDEDYDEEAQPTVNLFEAAKQLAKRLPQLKDVGDEEANRLREDILYALNEDPEDEFQQKTITKGKCTDAQADHFIEEWRAMHEERQKHEQEEAEEEAKEE